MTARRWTPAKVVKVWLDVVLAVAALGIVLLALYLAATPFFLSEGKTADFSVTVALGERTFVPILRLEVDPEVTRNDVAVHQVTLVKGYAELRAQTQSWGLHFASMGLIELLVIAVFYAIRLLRDVVKTVLAGEPFAPSNSRRLSRIGFIALAVSVIVPAAEYLIGRAMLAELNVVGLALSPALRLSTDGVLLGLLFLVLAAIFRHGTELERERALTV